MRESRIRLLVLYAQYTTRLSYFDDWLHAFRTYPAFDVVDVDIASSEIATETANSVLSRRTPLSCSIPQMVTQRNIWSRLLRFSPIAECRCFHSSAMKSICPDRRSRRSGGYLAKSGPTGSRPKCLRRRAGSYSVTWSRESVVAIPHALNPDAFRPSAALDERSIDIGTRLSRYLPHLGDDDRNRLTNAFETSR